MIEIIFCQEGQEELEVLVHAAANVHKLKSANGKPRTFVSLKVSKSVCSKAYTGARQ